MESTSYLDHDDHDGIRIQQLEREQDRLANILRHCWNLDCGPSKRYLKRLIKEYVKRVEKNNADAIQSDSLAQLVVQASLFKIDAMPNANEACHSSFYLPPERIRRTSADKAPRRYAASSLSDTDHVRQHFLRVRVFPYHNDVALRLWEAAAALAEFFLDNQETIRNREVLELGAGVGLTGLVLQACCAAKSTYLTDCTQMCRENLQHNLELNQAWLMEHGADPAGVQQGYLEWGAFGDPEYVPSNDDEKMSQQAFEGADVLIAADVIYDVKVIDSLVQVIHKFLANNHANKEAILAVTKRNMKTFQLFLNSINKQGFVCECLVRDCSTLPKIFHCNFTQDRCDVLIARLTLEI
jgi:predicted nicotinamide N-methyase